MSVYLSVENLSITFKINNVSANKTLGSSSSNRNNYDIGGEVIKDKNDLYVQAVRNISFSLKNGDRLGIIGSNGAGKSTLIRGIAGIIPISKGAVSYSGSMLAALSAVGGVEQDISVQDNILYRAALLGYRVNEPNIFVEEILDWAEVPQYRHLPYRSLSPGMMARVGFGLTTAFTCDILLIDEWIGVGDSSFISRSKERWEKMVSRAGIMIVCSHAESIIKKYCNKTLKLNSGECVSFETIS